MTNDHSSDYSDDSDKTVFIPRPGGRSPAPAPNAAPAAPAPPSFGSFEEEQERILSGVNPLVSAASALLSLTSSLRGMVSSHHDIEGLRRQMLDEIKRFEVNARRHGFGNEVTYTSRYVLCAFIDESILTTIWGSSSVWSQRGLLSSLHNEVNGGENFFVILDRLLKEPNASLDLIELMFICLCLGFKGRYSMMDRGQEKLEEQRNFVFNHIRQRRGEFPQDLSPNWQSPSVEGRGLRHHVPLWVVIAVACAILAAVFVGFSLVLEETAEPVLQRLDQIATHDIINDVTEQPQ